MLHIRFSPHRSVDKRSVDLVDVLHPKALLYDKLNVLEESAGCLDLAGLTMVICNNLRVRLSRRSGTRYSSIFSWDSLVAQNIRFALFERVSPLAAWPSLAAVNAAKSGCAHLRILDFIETGGVRAAVAADARDTHASCETSAHGCLLVFSYTLNRRVGFGSTARKYLGSWQCARQRAKRALHPFTSPERASCGSGRLTLTQPGARCFPANAPADVKGEEFGARSCGVS